MVVFCCKNEGRSIGRRLLVWVCFGLFFWFRVRFGFRLGCKKVRKGVKRFKMIWKDGERYRKAAAMLP